MCELCGSKEERQKGAQAAIDFAEDLRELSVCYFGLASGALDPHSNDVKRTVILSKQIIRKLVSDWV